MNADLGQAIGFLSPSQQKIGSVETEAVVIDRGTEHWRWRFRMAQRIAADLDPRQFGVKAFYLMGSAKNAAAGPASDIDLLLHFQGNGEQRKDLLLWLEGWSWRQCLGEINFLRTGCRNEGLLDVHLVTDRDIAERSSFAVKIDAITDPARKLSMKDSKT
jgi:pyruvate,water dikinase